MGRTSTGHITQAQAAEILGVSKAVVNHLVRSGVLPSAGTRGRASLDRRQVQRLAARRKREQEKRELERERRPEPYRAPQPPDQEHDWLTLAQAAELLGRSRQGIEYRCKRDSIPHEVHDGRRWLRRDLLELWARAQSARLDLNG